MKWVGYAACHQRETIGIYDLGMRKPILSLAALLMFVLCVSKLPAQAYEAKPKLVVILVIDQFRGDYLERYRDSFATANGFNLFLKKGAYFGSCYYDYANTKTAPGHSTIGTGAYTDGHGIGSNEWWDLSRSTDHPVSSVEDERYRLVGTFDDLPVPEPPAIDPKAPRVGSSPFNLKATTIGDEVRLATAGESKLYGVSLKDRAAILPSGQTANGAFWIDQATGRFVTSTYYMEELPEWATKFNKGPRVAQAVKDAGLDSTTQFYNMVGRTPAANSYELAFAEALIDGEKLGTHKVTDVLTVSLSANDIVGHQLGPDSDAEKEMVLALDKDINAFFTDLDKKVGLGNVLVGFTADHGIAPIPAESAKLGVQSARLDLEQFVDFLNASLNKRFPAGGGKVKFFLPNPELPYVALDPRVFEKLGVKEADAEAAVAEVVPDAVKAQGTPAGQMDNPTTIPEGKRTYAESRVDADPRLAFVRTKVELADGKIPATEFGRMVSHSYTDHGGWYVMVVPTAYQMEYLSGIQTTHFSPWSYDRHVPLGFFGAEIVPGRYREQVAPVDLAATFASLLGVNAPSASVGRVLVEMVKAEK
jgi:predicted AlkP superfamily pyrophosphatase or phosphodiesterase